MDILEGKDMLMRDLSICHSGCKNMLHLMFESLSSRGNWSKERKPEKERTVVKLSM